MAGTAWRRDGMWCAMTLACAGYSNPTWRSTEATSADGMRRRIGNERRNKRPMLRRRRRRPPAIRLVQSALERRRIVSVAGEEADIAAAAERCVATGRCGLGLTRLVDHRHHDGWRGCSRKRREGHD